MRGALHWPFLGSSATFVINKSWQHHPIFQQDWWTFRIKAIPTRWRYSWQPRGSFDIVLSSAGALKLESTHKAGQYYTDTSINFNTWLSFNSHSLALKKGQTTTTWIWNSHSFPHAFIIQDNDITLRKYYQQAYHTSLLYFQFSGISSHGAYFSNYLSWINNFTDSLPSSHIVWTITNQHHIEL